MDGRRLDVYSRKDELDIFYHYIIGNYFPYQMDGFIINGPSDPYIYFLVGIVFFGSFFCERKVLGIEMIYLFLTENYLSRPLEEVWEKGLYLAATKNPSNFPKDIHAKFYIIPFCED